MKKRRKVAILGCSFCNNEFDEDEFEIWSMNNGFLVNSHIKFTRWFELHRIDEIDGTFYRRDIDYFKDKTVRGYLEDLNKLDIPVYMHKKWKIVKKSIAFPLVKILNRFPRGYFTNSFAWMVALAIIEGFKEINLHGVCEFQEDFSEFYVHKLSTEYLLGVAEGLGIKIFVPNDSGLLKCRYLYGFQENPYTYEKHISELESRRGLFSKDLIENHIGLGHV